MEGMETGAVTRRLGGGESMALLMFALGTVIGVGSLYNNLVNSGLGGSVTMTCAQVYPFTCTNSSAVGCQSLPAQCKIQGNSISFLNQNSPFTFFFTGNIGGFFSALSTSSNLNRGAYDPNGGGVFYKADCYLTGVPAGTNMTSNTFGAHINGCTEINPDNSNKTQLNSFGQQNTFPYMNWNTVNFGSTLTHYFYQVFNNATYALTCYNEGYWFVTSQPTVGYSYFGCDFYKTVGYSPPANTNTQAVYSFLVAFPANLQVGGISNNAMPTGNYHMKVFVQPENWDTQFCTNAFKAISPSPLYYSSQNCVNLETWFTTPKSGGLQAGFFTPFLTLLIGIVLFVIGLGIQLHAGGSIFASGTQFGIGVNAQGTRMAQIVGLGLIVWSPMSSEFGTWISSSTIPFGLDILVNFLLFGAFFFALYERL